MKYILTVLLLVSMSACGSFGESSDAKREQEYQELYNANEEKRIKHKIQDSINRIEEKIAIGNINFGINSIQFKKESEAFKTEIKNQEQSDSLRHKYGLGEFQISDINGKFLDDKLFQLMIKGEMVKYDKYKEVLPNQYNSLIKIFTQKYGKPKENKGLPSWTMVKMDEVVKCAYWRLGQKQIDIELQSIDVYYAININIREMAMWFEDIKGLGNEEK